jgi:hypothetical protein
MARRYDQYYRVKPRDNLGDPDYWNRRFEDFDRRISSNEDGLDAIGGLTAYVEGLALDRLDLVLSPALDKITLVSEQGFLLAHSSSTVTLDVNTTQTFAIPDQAERELFAPSPFLTLCRTGSMTDYAFARLVSYDKPSGQLTVQPLQIYGNAGPFDDWVIYVGTALSQAIVDFLAQTMAARDATIAYRDDAQASAAATASDKTAVATYRSDALAARNAAQLAALNAQLWDPTGYAQTSYVDTKIADLVNSAPTQLDTIKELATALGNDANFSGTISASLGFRLRVDVNNQGLTGTQQQNGRTNLGLGTISTKNVVTLADLRTNTGTDALTTDVMWSATAFINKGATGSGTLTVDATAGARQLFSLTGAITVAIANGKNGQVMDLIFVQDATGGRTISWNAAIRFPDNIAPTVATAASGYAVIVSAVFDGINNQWLAVGWKVT